MPFEESGSSSNLYYSFEVAGAHIVMLGSYDDYDVYSEQYKWLKVRWFPFRSTSMSRILNYALSSSVFSMKSHGYILHWKF
jgi:hypothetical protein